MGRFAFVGGGEWRDECSVEAEVLGDFGVSRVLVVATAAASFGPARRVERAVNRFTALGIDVADGGVLRRADAMDDAALSVFDDVDAVYLGGGSSQHLVSVMSSTPWWRRLVEVVEGGVALIAAGASAAACTAVMLDERGGGFGVGLGAIDSFTVVPECDDLSADRARRVRELTPRGVPVAWTPNNAAIAVVNGSVIAYGEVEWTQDGVAIPPPNELSSREW